MYYTCPINVKCDSCSITKNSMFEMSGKLLFGPDIFFRKLLSDSEKFARETLRRIVFIEWVGWGKGGVVGATRSSRSSNF